MPLFTYSIFDSDPNVSGPSAWPDHDDVEVEADSAKDVLDEALEEARSVGGACGEYAPDDRLWVLVWDEDGIMVAADATLVGDDA